MRILLINVDSRWNMAIRKMYNFFRAEHEVEMRDLGLSGYPHKRRVTIDAADFDQVYVSNIFDNNADRVEVINCSAVIYGGIGSRDPHRQLPPEIEATEPYYFPEEDTSHGFITRGCIRNCWFCKVPKYEGKLKAYNSIESIVKHKKVKFYDNNILAYPHHMDVFRWLLDHPDIKVEFNQGLDFRLVNDENLDALSRLNYMGAYIFAFDEPKYQPLLDKKLVLMKKYISRPWALKFYIYYHPDMDLGQLFDRVEWCRRNECLPYIMRDRACWECEDNKRNFLIDYASYCNQAGLFKKLTFEQFMEKRTKNEERRHRTLEIYEGIKEGLITMKLGSLFDGSGGFPLSGALCGIEPTWAAEVEPYPIAVTRSRFPGMRHLGDISKVSGADIEPVDIITFGSPCQDLSVAGKRAGLKHEANGDDETTRSGLFMEAVRIIKEMRKATNGVYPRFALWENVPGAFSSNKGEDFRIVCEELIKVVEPRASMPSVPQKGWPYSDSYIGDGWSLAYRVFDAQYWGVPQRRRRIHLVVDFRGQCAREVLFEREGVRGYFAQGRTPWQNTPAHAQDCIGADDCQGGSAGGRGAGDARDRGDGGRQLDAVAYTLKIRSDCDVDSAGKAAGKGALVQTEKAATLACVQDQYLFQPTAYSFDSMASNSMKSSNPLSGCREVEVAKTLDTSDPNPSKNQGGIAIVEPMAFAQNQRDEVRDLGDKVGALQAQPGMKQQTFIIDSHILDDQGGSVMNVRTDGKAPTLRAQTGGHLPVVLEPTVYDGTLRSCAQGAIAFAMEQHLFENHSQDTRYRGPLDVSPIVSATFGMGGNNQPFVVEGKPTVYDGANVTSPVNASNPQPGDPCHTLSTDSRNILVEPVFCLQGNGIDRPAAVYLANGKQVAGTLCSGAAQRGFSGGQEIFNGNYHIIEETPPPIRYIVRRLTPTECARLQGFADQHGHLEQKTDLTDEEYSFWLEVRNTHAAINGKPVKDYTKPQMLAWYNRLWTDAAEYKMWGNGIALPPALYCMQGIVDAMNKEEDDSWLM